MHAVLLNEARFKLQLEPKTPLLIKAGGSSAVDPLAVDMQFVRTRAGKDGGSVYVPGSSLRGVVRAHAEKLVRSLSEDAACNPLGDHRCTRNKVDQKATGPEAYLGSCWVCRLFGNTALSSRVKFADLIPDTPSTLETRYGVAIDRITGAVAHGPFEMEVLTQGRFEGSLQLRNFTIGQLGLLAAALLDLSDGLVGIGYGKSRGLGRVKLDFVGTEFRSVGGQSGKLSGAGALASPARASDYKLPPAKDDVIDAPPGTHKTFRGIQTLVVEGQPLRDFLESVANRWVQEIPQESRR